MTARDDRRDLLFDMLVASPKGTDYDEIIATFGWWYPDAVRAVHDLRLVLSDTGDDITVTLTPQGKGERWLIRLEGTVDGARPWVTNRILDSESRMATMHAVLRPLVQATDGRTMEGRKVRRMERGLRHLIEDLGDIGGGGL